MLIVASLLRGSK